MSLHISTFLLEAKERALRDGRHIDALLQGEVDAADLLHDGPEFARVFF